MANVTIADLPAVATPTGASFLATSQAGATKRITTDQLAAFSALLAAPTGMLAAFPFAAAPSGWLKSNGAVISIASYPALAAILYCGDANNPTATHGFRSTDAGGLTRNIGGGYITIPDARGEFLRGFDDGRLVDSGRNLWISQADDLKSHTHTVPMAVATYYFGGSSTPVAQTGTSTSGATGGTETRPRNIAALISIKY